MIVSIIIPFKEWNNYVEKCVSECLKLDYKNFEVILIPDSEISFKHRGVKVLVNNGKPSVKRNLGASVAKGGVLAFIDSDAYPDKDWLVNGTMYFREEVGIIGGPNLTPPEAGFFERIGGDILSSYAVGSMNLRYRKGKKQDVGELPSCNLFVRKELFLGLKGFDEKLLTGEDSKLCFEMKEKLGKRVVYSPDIIVYHHRRKFLFPHLKQLFVYGRDKAFLAKEKFRFYYAIPSLFVLYLVFGFVASLFSSLILNVYTYSLIAYLIVIGLLTFRLNIIKWPFVFVGVILTHISYGIGFLRGYL